MGLRAFRPAETYLLGGEDATFLEMIRLAATILGKPVPSGTSPAWQLKATARVSALLAGLML